MIPKILQVLVAQLVYTMFAHRFTCGERKIWQNIEKPQNIMKLIVVYVVVASSKEFSSAEIFFFFFFSRLVDENNSRRNCCFDILFFD